MTPDDFIYQLLKATSHLHAPLVSPFPNDGCCHSTESAPRPTSKIP